MRYGKINGNAFFITAICGLYMAIEKNPRTNFQDLKEKREEFGLSLKDVFGRTRISVVYLEAIENGDFHLLPLPIYAKNFINTYARFLGVDSKLIIARYEDYLSSLNILDNIPPADISEEATFFGAIARHSTFLGIASFLIVIACVIWLISMQYTPAADIIKDQIGESAVDISASKGNTTSQEANAIVPLNERTSDNLEPAINDSGRQTQTPSLSPESAGNVSTKASTKASVEKDAKAEISAPQPDYKESSRLIIEATEETWIRIKAGQKPPFQVLLRPGEKIEYKAAIFDMDIGNAGGVKIQFKDKKIENLGKSGEVIRLRLP